jgi:hypothetical protein
VPKSTGTVTRRRVGTRAGPPFALLTATLHLARVATRREELSVMQKCPACGNGVPTPFFLNLDEWTHLRCSQCDSRLEMQPPRSFLLGPLMAPLFVLARQGRIFERIAFVFAFATIFLIVFESLKPKLRLRKKAPAKPEISLKIDRPAN